ncbi:DUF4943 family protein [Pontibacter sp. G13]|uniref:DUF4943 family protein n=1 Tax=Pontibacter sp. G13 TaxID=3074898 RepID=UPI00288BA74F|nr:DUF4943 family protein [Pontibacter sp. G13]WNJ16738.1 DUF4943 family protein [Pontibacter sp. G13]
MQRLISLVVPISLALISCSSPRTTMVRIQVLSADSIPVQGAQIVWTKTHRFDGSVVTDTLEVDEGGRLELACIHIPELYQDFRAYQTHFEPIVSRDGGSWMDRDSLAWVDTQAISLVLVPIAGPQLPHGVMRGNPPLEQAIPQAIQAGNWRWVPIPQIPHSVIPALLEMAADTNWIDQFPCVFHASGRPDRVRRGEAALWLVASIRFDHLQSEPSPRGLRTVSSFPVLQNGTQSARADELEETALRYQAWWEQVRETNDWSVEPLAGSGIHW